MLLKSALFMACVVCALVHSASSVGADCKLPELESFLEDSRAVLKFNGSYFPSPVPYKLEFKVGAQGLHWFGVGWEAPPDGALFVLDCAGNRLAARRLGQVFALRYGPVLPSIGSTVEVSYVAQTGTGYKRESANLFAFVDKDLRSLWTHTIREHVAVLPLEEQTFEEYQWIVRSDGQQIRVDGFRTIYPKRARLDTLGGPPATYKVSPETFCWDAGRILYLLCSGSQ